MSEPTPIRPVPDPEPADAAPDSLVGSAWVDLLNNVASHGHDIVPALTVFELGRFARDHDAQVTERERIRTEAETERMRIRAEAGLPLDDDGTSGTE